MEQEPHQTVRAFIGIPLPQEWKRQLSMLQHGVSQMLQREHEHNLPKLSWSKPETWHLTLQFLGDQPMDKLETLKEAVQEELKRVPFRTFLMQPGDVRYFGSRKQPRVFWLDISEGKTELQTLAQAIDNSCKQVGIELEDRLYTPHLTLARAKYPRQRSVRCNALPVWEALTTKCARLRWAPTRIDTVILWQSTLTSQGPKHEELWNIEAD